MKNVNLSGFNENEKFILDEDYRITRDIYHNQPVKITSNGNVKLK
jgi:hypothetical protein